ncbi:MAG: glycosyltransferase family 2 protein [Candidatus Omnitrophica bacterium]|nr:glycosyltransferase family 2 protein [Candidatus Omnitrophota bacterium]
MTVRRCDIILPTCGQTELIKNCIESLIGSSDYPCRLIAIDNGNSEEASAYLKKMAKSGRLDMILIKPEENLGWVKSINHGLEFSKDSEYVSFQNDDTVFTKGWMDEIAGVFEKDPEIGIVNPEWEKPEGIDINKYALELKQKYGGQTIDMDWCRGHCFVVKRELVQKIGGFDPVYIPVYYDDRDYSLKAIEAGYRCVKAKGSFVDHVRNVTMKSTMQQEKIAELMDRNGRIFYKRWGYPLRIVFVLRDVSGSKELLKKMCMDQNKVIVITRDKQNVPYEHTNMKVLKFGGALFNIAALFYLASNRSKKQQKKTDFVFTADKSFYSFSKPLARFIPAQIVFNNDPDSFAPEALKIVREKKCKEKSCQ